MVLPVLAKQTGTNVTAGIPETVAAATGPGNVYAHIHTKFHFHLLSLFFLKKMI